MRPPAFRLFVLLLAWCVGFPSTATAMGMRCAHARAATTDAHAAMPAGMHHAGMSMPMDGASSSIHQHHQHMGGGAEVSADAKTGIEKIGCHCGCNCTTVGCVGGGPGIASLPPSHFFAASPAAFEHPEAASGLRAAHGLDLIRPPSKS